MAPEEQADRVPVRTILASIGFVLLTLAGLVILSRLGRIIGLIVVSGFFAIILGPAVNLLQHRARMRRGWATFIVFITGLALLAGMIYAFVRPIIDQTQEFVRDLPEFVEDAKAGKGTIGELVQRYDIDEYIEENQDRLDDALRSAGRRAPDLLGRLANGVVATLTIVVLTYLMLLQGPKMQAATLAAIQSAERRERVRRVAGDCARAVSGYMAGNLLISIIAGTATYIFLLILNVPFKEVLALWVAFADLIPLIGATIGAVPSVLVAVLDSVPKGIATLIFFIAYQQFENHVLQVTVMSRTVQVNPLTVLVSILVGVELFGVLGALLAIPVAGAIQVVVRDVWDERQGRLKREPTVGTEELPVSEAEA